MSDERKPITDEELDAIKKRTDAITPGPWRVYYAHVPEDIARLLAEVEQLRKEHAWLLQEVAKINRTPVYCPMPDRYECLYHVGNECRSKEDEMRVGCWRTAVECAVKCGEKSNAE